MPINATPILIRIRTIAVPNSGPLENKRPLTRLRGCRAAADDFRYEFAVVSYAILLGFKRLYHATERLCASDPHPNDAHQDGREVWRGGRQRSEGDDEDLRHRKTKGSMT